MSRTISTSCGTWTRYSIDSSRCGRRSSDGDLRPLYLAHLAAARDGNHDPEETVEAPVPAGLRKPTVAQRALAEFCGLSDALIAAAARESGPLPAAEDQLRPICRSGLPASPRRQRMPGLPNCSATRTRRHDRRSGRSLKRLRPSSRGRRFKRAGRLRSSKPPRKKSSGEQKKEAAAKAARQRAKRLQKMAADPTPFLRETERLVAQRSTDAYQQVSELLADLREALAGSKQSGLAEKQALKLKTDESHASPPYGRASPPRFRQKVTLGTSLSKGGYSRTASPGKRAEPVGQRGLRMHQPNVAAAGAPLDGHRGSRTIKLRRLRCAWQGGRFSRSGGASAEIVRSSVDCARSSIG